MNTNYNRNGVITSLIWKLLERGGTQGIQFIVQIILARLLDPAQFGTIALMLVIINLAQVFIQSGFSSALIQKKDVNNIDFSSVFYLTLMVSIVLYGIIYVSGPFIADYYDNDSLSSLIRAFSIVLFPGSLNSVQNAFVSRKMMFNKIFVSSVVSAVFSGIVGISLALLDFGVWALVFQQISFQFSNAIIMWLIVKWRPEFVFSPTSIKEMFGFSSRLLVSDVVYILYMDLRTLIIGSVYSPSMLGYYQRGEQFPRFIVNNINGSIQSVLFPTLSASQHDLKEMKRMMRRAIKTSSYLIFPMMVGLAVISESFITLLLTDKWLPAVPFLQLFCISYAFWPLLTINLQAIKALGKSDTILILETVKRGIGIIIIIVSLQHGVYMVALGSVLERLVETVLNAYPNQKYLNYSFVEQFKDINPYIFASIVMGLCAYFIKFFFMGPLLTMLVQIFTGLVVYLLISGIFKLDSYEYLKTLFITNYLFKQKNRRM